MTDNPLYDEHDAPAVRLVSDAREFARHVVEPGAVSWERERRIDRDALRAAAGIGLTGIQVPAEQGGRGSTFRCKAAVTCALAEADFGFAMSLVNTHNVAAKLAREAPARLASALVPPLLGAERLGSTALSERGAGSDFPAIVTRAHPLEAGGWRLDGHKAWITNAAASDIWIVYAKVGEGDDAAQIASFVVDGRRAGVERDPPAALCGQHTIGTGGFRLDGYEAAPDEMLSPPGEAFKAALTSINGARIYIAAMCCGMVARSIEVASTYGIDRSTFGRPLASHQGWRWRIAEAAAELAAAQSLVDRAARALDLGVPVVRIAAQAKVFATRMAERHLAALQHALGAAGLDERLPLGRHLVGVQVAGFVDGSTEMLLERIGRS